MTTSSSFNYLFLLGRTPKLSLAELFACFPETTFETLSDTIVRGSFAIPLDCIHWMSVLGGTVKIAKEVDEVSEVSTEYLAARFSSLAGGKKISFGVSCYGGVEIGASILSEIKDILNAQGISCRFVVGKQGELSSVVIEKQGVIELMLVGKSDGRIIVAETVAVQPFEAWNRRDYSRPFADPKAGMLPPKVARMAVNIALSNIRPALNDQRITLLDPFCGMGTILAEAALEGISVIGSDNNEQVVKYTQKNLEWLVSDIHSHGTAIAGTMGSFKIFVSDATHISEKLSSGSVDTIVTEPFMGTTDFGSTNGQLRKREEKVKNSIKGLEKLYIGCLKDWHGVLKSGGVIVIALPKYIVDKHEYFVKTVIDRCENLGYTTLQGPLEYSRPQAVVRREFFVFQKS